MSQIIQRPTGRYWQVTTAIKLPVVRTIFWNYMYIIAAILISRFFFPPYKYATLCHLTLAGRFVTENTILAVQIWLTLSQGQRKIMTSYLFLSKCSIHVHLLVFPTRFSGWDFFSDCAGSWSLPTFYFLALQLILQVGCNLIISYVEKVCQYFCYCLLLFCLFVPALVLELLSLTYNILSQIG